MRRARGAVVPGRDGAATGEAGELVSESEGVMGERFACKVCGNVPDSEGNLEHGKGCYTQSADGGGDEYIEEADRSLDTIERRLRETVEQATGGQWASRGVVGSHAELTGPGGHGALGFLHEPDELGAYAVDQQFLGDLAHIAAACPDNIRVLLAELDRLRGRVATLTVALERYGNHEHDCKTILGWHDEECDCGLDAALEGK